MFSNINIDKCIEFIKSLHNWKMFSKLNLKLITYSYNRINSVLVLKEAFEHYTFIHFLYLYICLFKPFKVENHKNKIYFYLNFIIIYIFLSNNRYLTNKYGNNKKIWQKFSYFNWLKWKYSLNVYCDANTIGF